MVVALRRVALSSLIVWLGTAPAPAQTLEVQISPAGSAAKNLPLPVGSTPNLSVTIRNRGSRPVGPISLSAKPEGLAPVAAQGWRVDSGTLIGELPRLGAGDRAERTLRLKVERAPLQPTKQKVVVEVRTPDGGKVSAEAEINVADCVGAYREKLAVLRSGILQEVRDAAENLRKSDASLPSGRIFLATNARSGDLANAERLVATLAGRRGGDPQMATEWFQFIIQRWTSELTLYSNQTAAPGLCANNYYQIAGYRQGLTPITSRIDAIHNAADRSLVMAREAAKSEATDETIAVLARRVVKVAAPDAEDTQRPTFDALTAARDTLRGNGSDPAALRTLSLVETAAWLAETDKRGQALQRAIDRVLASIATAHKESCVCAF